MFCEAEQVIRAIDRDRDSVGVAVVDVSRVKDIDDAARTLLAGVSASVLPSGKTVYFVDPRGVVVNEDFEAISYRTLDEAVASARALLRDTSPA
jgi:glutaminase